MDFHNFTVYLIAAKNLRVISYALLVPFESLMGFHEINTINQSVNKFSYESNLNNSFISFSVNTCLYYINVRYYSPSSLLAFDIDGLAFKLPYVQN